MGKEFTAEQVLEQNVAAMPSPLGQIYHSLYIEVVVLHLKWKNYRALFGKDKEN